MSTDNDFTPMGTKIEGQYENDRNAEHSEFYKAIIREAFGVKDVIIAHHLVYVTEEIRPDPDHPGKTYNFQIVEEIPSADTLLFDHEVAKKLWGDRWKIVLSALAVTPPEERDTLARKFFDAR